MKSNLLKRKILLLIFFFSIVIVHAQNKLSIYKADGSYQTFSLSDISKLTFTESDMLINQNTGNPISIEIENIAYMGFKPASTAVLEIQAESLNVYPNPVTTNLTVKHIETIDELKIFDVQGKMCLYLSPKKENVDIDMSLFPAGIYFLRIVSDKKVNTNKVIKSNN